MTAFINIIMNIIFPIFFLITVGFIAQKKFNLDIRTFAKLNMYVFLPAIIFSKIYRTEVTLELFSTIFVYLILIFIGTLALGTLITRMVNYPRGVRNTFTNSLLFFNAGNYGLPVAEIAFQSNPLATTVQIFIMVIQHILLNTFGVFQASRGRNESKQALQNVFLMPALHMLVLVIIIKTFGIVIPEFLMVPVENLGKGFIPIALITLGVQLAEVKISVSLKDILIFTSARLILGPLMGLGLVMLMGVEGLLAKVLILGVATPTAVNVAIIAREFDSEPEYASQIVFITTLLSAVTISLLIMSFDYI